MLKNKDTFSLPHLEEKVLSFWKKNKIFEKTLLKNRGKKKFIFYEGPPTANGRPGIHHVITRAFKDVILRYKTMRGYYVPRRAGWDTHGLPVELEVEKQLGLKSKKEIEAYGIAAFNKKCKESVWKYKDEWEKLTDRMGFWIDMKNPYITYKNDYIAEIWNIVKEIEKKKLLYKGHKVVPWCPRCGTALSSHELAQGYQEIKDNSIYVKFKVKKDQKIDDFFVNEKTYLVSWTTTPWTLPGNVALAVNKKIKYHIIKYNGEFLIISKKLVETIITDEFEFIKDVEGKDLIGISYEPLFHIPSLHSIKSYKVYDASFVTDSDGTGIVHTAVMYGEDDYALGVKENLPQFHTVNEQGRFISEVKGLEGLLVKIPETEKKIIEYLKEKNNWLKTVSYSHEYPHCWRCGTALLYYARHSWFIKMSSLRETLVKENKKINWIPQHFRDGRFGEWIKEAKDWTISRERYWGTPLPIWECKNCNNTTVFTEEDFKKIKSNNSYILMRHGESESNIKNIISSYPEKKKMPLTKLGILQVKKAAQKLQKEKIDMIFCSDIFRTKETARIVSEKIGIPVYQDERLREVNCGLLNGKSIFSYRLSEEEKFFIGPEGGESRNSVRKRMWSFLSDIEKKYSGKKILIVSHYDPLWMLFDIMKGTTIEEAITIATDKQQKMPNFSFANPKKVSFSIFPRDEWGAKDFHKPYIDEVIFPCDKCKKMMHRTSEVMDVWFDSGAMPWTQNEHIKKSFLLRKSNIDFPADYIVEGVDQTRGWFYTLLAISVLLNRGVPYRNVISLGLLLDKNGHKMSKSKGNTVNPWEIFEKYGIDVTRWFFYTVNPPGESKRFDEQELLKISRQLFLLLYNSFVFFDLYALKKLSNKKIVTSSHILDKWILTRFDSMVNMVTFSMEKYEIEIAAREIGKFTDDLSRWYIRRSRKRFQRPVSKKDYYDASITLAFILREMSKILAPFVPFFAEALYKSFSERFDSVHNTNWPLKKNKSIDKNLLILMEEIRTISSLALRKRAEKGIKVRQPLATLKIRSNKLNGLKGKELIEILKDEINVKKIIIDNSLKEMIELDTIITPDLLEEGILRELIRVGQDLRQEIGMNPKNKAFFSINIDNFEFLKKEINFLKKELNASSIEIMQKKKKMDAETSLVFERGKIFIGIRKK